MPSTSNIMEGVVTDSDGNVLANIDVTLNNSTKGESHVPSDDGFADLQTNAQGEWSGNLGSFTDGWDVSDNVSYSASDSTYGSDSDTTTVVSGGRQNLNLMLVSDAVSKVNLAITSVGESVDWDSLDSGTTYRGNYGDINAESFTRTSITASIQIQSDDSKLMEWGEIGEGEALGFFKAKHAVKKGDKIRVPQTTGDWWAIHKVVEFREGGERDHYECVLRLLE